MSIPPVFSCLALAALLLALSCGTNLHAATGPAENRSVNAIEQEDQFQPMAIDRGAEAELLREAYGTLAVADHDYKGHRVRAMKHIEEAAKLLGVTLHGNGKGHEKQAISDAQLRGARAQLQQLNAALAGRKQPHVVKQVELAIEEISIALKIR